MSAAKEETPPTMLLVGFAHETVIKLSEFDAASTYGLQTFSSIDALRAFSNLPKFGCIALDCTQGSRRSTFKTVSLCMQLTSLPVICLVNEQSATDGVDLMRSGVNSILFAPLNPSDLLLAAAFAVQQYRKRAELSEDLQQAGHRMKAATRKEREVLRLILDGQKNKQIAEHLNITVRAVEDRRFRLMKKVGVDSVAQLVALAVKAELHHCVDVAAIRDKVIVEDPQSCLGGIEVWKPDANGQQLRLAESCYADTTTFEEAGRDLSFHRRQGLPGMVWERNAPVFLQDLKSSAFVRSKAAQMAQLTTAFGFPVFGEGRVVAIVLILVRGQALVTAAIESWRLDPDTSTFRIVDGTYLNCAKLERLSRLLHLPVGVGLAGRVAEKARPEVVSGPELATNSVREGALAAEQLTCAASIPLTDSGAAISDVMVMFNSVQSPLFTLNQIWKPTQNTSQFELVTEVVDGVSTPNAESERIVADHESLVMQTVRHHRPALADPDHIGVCVNCCQTPRPLKMAIAVPTMINGTVVCVTVFAS